MNEPEPEPGPAPTRAERPWPAVSLLRRAGPVVLIVAALIAAGVLATTHENKGTTAATSGTGSSRQIGHSTVPLTYAAAAKVGKTSAYDWGSECDHATGRLKMPTVYAPPCVPVFTGSNGGATSSGVSGSAINVVYYQMQPGGLASTISAAAGTNAQELATAQAYVAMFNQVYGLYGRHVNLIPFTASGADTDPVAAHADAVTVAQQLHAFASINGPGETTAYQDELARLHVLCLACGDSSTNGEIQKNAPFQWANLPTADTSLFETIDYVAAKLSGKDAVWAGDPSFHSQKRKFIVVSETSEPPAPGYAQLTAELTKKLTAGHVDMASPTDLTYTLNLTTLPTSAATIAEKLKASGATSVIFAGDPIMPIYLTKACANIGYFPEWIITGIALDGHIGARALLRPERMVARLRRDESRRAGTREHRRRRPSLPLVVRAQRHAGRRWPRRRSSRRSSSSSRACNWPGRTSRPTRSPPGCSAPHRRAAGPRRRSMPTATRAPRRARATRPRPTTRSSGTTPPRKGPTRRASKAPD